MRNAVTSFVAAGAEVAGTEVGDCVFVGPDLIGVGVGLAGFWVGVGVDKIADCPAFGVGVIVGVGPDLIGVGAFDGVSETC